MARQIYQRRTRNLTNPNQNLTGKAIGAIGHSIGKAIDDAKADKASEDAIQDTASDYTDPTFDTSDEPFDPNSVEVIDEASEEFDIEQGLYDDELEEVVDNTPEVVKSDVTPKDMYGDTDTEPITLPDVVTTPSDTVGGEWTGQNFGGTSTLDVTGGGANTFGFEQAANTGSGGGGPQYGPDAKEDVDAFGFGPRYRRQQQGPARLAGTGNSPNSRKPELSPFKRYSPLKNLLEKAQGLSFGPEQVQRDVAPSYLGQIGAAAAEGYNIAVDRHNYKRGVWEKQQKDLSDQFASLEVGPSGVSSIDASKQIMAQQWKKSLADLMRNKDQYSPEEYTTKVDEIKSFSKQFAAGNARIQQLVKDYAGDKDNISLGTDPKNIDIIDTLYNGGDGLTVQNVNGVPTLVGSTNMQQNVSIPLSELANGKNIPKYVKKVPVAQTIIDLSKEISQIKTDIETANGGVYRQSVGWDAVEGSVNEKLDALLESDATVRAIAAERLGVDFDMYEELIASGIDPKERVKKYLRESIRQISEPNRGTTEVRQRGFAPKAPPKGNYADRTKQFVADNPITTPEGLNTINQSLSKSGHRVVNHPDAGYIIVDKNNKAVSRIDPNNPVSLYSYMGVRPGDQPAEQAPTKRKNPLKRMMDFFASPFKRNSPLKDNGDDKWAEHYARLRKKGVSHAQANKWIARQEGSRQISIDEGIAINKAGGSKFESNEPSKQQSKFEAPSAKKPPRRVTAAETARVRAQVEAQEREAARPQQGSTIDSGYTAHGNKVPLAYKSGGSAEGGHYVQYGGQGEITPSREGPGSRWLEDWYSDPETKRRFRTYQGGDQREVDSRIAHQAQASVRSFNDPNSRASATYSPREHQIGINQAGNVSDVDRYLALPHERVHASGFDERVGPQVKQILGNQLNVGQDSKTKQYYDNPEELYGKLTNLRVKLKLKPGQKVTKDMLKGIKSSKKYGEDILRLYDNDKIIKALNTVADTEGKPKKNLKQLYSKPKTALTRKKKYAKRKR